MFNHLRENITDRVELVDIIKLVKHYKPAVIAIDTETNGLNLVLSMPFLFQFGFVTGQTYHTYTIDLEQYRELGMQTILTVFNLAKEFDIKIIGHNIKYDLHMLTNFGFSKFECRLGDTMINIRLAHDALTPANGGPPLGLKAYAAQYIDSTAKYHELSIDEERASIARIQNTKLVDALRHFKNPPKGFKTWNKGALEEFFSDPIVSANDLPEEMQAAYIQWYESIPLNIRNNMKSVFVEKDDIPYNILDRDGVTTYGHFDIKFTLAIYYKTIEVLINRGNEDGLKIEEDLIIPLYKMERVGFKINKQYINEARHRLYDYIKKQRAKMLELVGFPVSVNQHKLIKQILKEQFDLEVSTTSSVELDNLMPVLERDATRADAYMFIKLLQEMRTLEKWYTTYLTRFLNELRSTDRIYTQINQVGTVTGRVTSDFQQFPKYGILDDEGNPLFNPREMVIVSDKFIGLGYLDYSQIELRVQALYTILLGHPDLNLCRAYMPYQCHKEIGHGDPLDSRTDFDYNNPYHIAHAYDWKWIRNEDYKPWIKTDVHSATTHIAFPDVPIDSDEFKKLRSMGKRVNFAKNYGAQFNRIKQMFPDYDDETIKRIDDAYYTAFPGVKEYHRYCYDLASASAYATNLFGVRYYGMTGHKLINTLVQGSSAYFLKLKIIAVQQYLESKNYKTRFQMNIHDEMSFEIAEGEEHVLFELKEIMENFEGTLVPIVAELEVSKSTWAAKKEAHDIEDVTRLLC